MHANWHQLAFNVSKTDRQEGRQTEGRRTHRQADWKVDLEAGRHIDVQECSQADRLTKRKTETESQEDKHTVIETGEGGWHVCRQTDRHTYGKANRQAGGKEVGQAYRQLDRQTGR